MQLFPIKSGSSPIRRAFEIENLGAGSSAVMGVAAAPANSDRPAEQTLIFPLRRGEKGRGKSIPVEMRDGLPFAGHLRGRVQQDKKIRSRE